MKYQNLSYWIHSAPYSMYCRLTSRKLPIYSVDIPEAQAPPRPDYYDPWLFLPVKISLIMLLGIFLFDANLSLFNFLNSFAPTLGNGWVLLTVFGDTLVALAVCLPLARYRPDLAWAALLAALLAAVFVHSLKEPIGILRPAAQLSADTFYVIGKTYYGHNAFPSGHATTIATLCGIIVLGWGRVLDQIWRWWLLMMAILVGLSRITIGAH